MTGKKGENMLLKELNQYHASILSNIRIQLSIASKNGNKVAIYELSVEIKRLRVFFELMKEIGIKFNFKKIFNPIRELFKSAAIIRDAQVLQILYMELIANSDQQINISEYVNQLKQKEMRGVRKFLKDCKNFHPEVIEGSGKKIEEKLSKISKTTIESSAKVYLESMLDTLSQLRMKDVLDEHDLNNIRILCKKTHYTLGMISCCYSKTDAAILNDSLKKIHQALGHWHDTDIAIHFLQKILQQDNLKPLFSKTSYDIFRDLLEDRKQNYLSLFLKRLNETDFKIYPTDQGHPEVPQEKYAQNKIATLLEGSIPTLAEMTKSKIEIHSSLLTINPQNQLF